LWESRVAEMFLSRESRPPLSQNCIATRIEEPALQGGLLGSGASANRRRQDGILHPLKRIIDAALRATYAVISQ
jgi:hypothetical protein